MKCSVCHTNKAETSEMFAHSEMCLDCIVDMCFETKLVSEEEFRSEEEKHAETKTAED